DAQLGVIVAAAKDGANIVASRIALQALAGAQAQRSGGSLPPYISTRATSLSLARQAAGTYVSGQRRITLVPHDSTLHLHRDGSSAYSRLRLLADDTLIVDDALDFGARLLLRGDSMVLGSSVFARANADEIPNEPPATLRGLIGEYGWDYNTLYVYEQGGALRALIEWFFDYPLTRIDANTFAFPRSGLYTGERLVFVRDARGRATQVTAAGIVFKRRRIPGEDAAVFRITPRKPVAPLRRDALAASPPNESGDFRASDLVELARLDSTIKLDIRYATRDNFLGVPVYSQARAFLQRPAAEALVRAHRALRANGYGLLIHDGYRPWYVTKMFWDATPVASRIFVADPSQGSRHNRGCAVDLTLYELATGRPVVMPGLYDEMSDRSYPMYPGGTARQRALREVLRKAMEREGFRVYEAEWWHFDYQDWRQYRIGNQTFEQLRS
ncbi:MAG: M15 family metallopeptidase, partial [Gemmatimonadota bacterium]